MALSWPYISPPPSPGPARSHILHGYGCRHIKSVGVGAYCGRFAGATDIVCRAKPSRLTLGISETMQAGKRA